MPQHHARPEPVRRAVVLTAFGLLAALFLWTATSAPGQTFGSKGIPAKGFKIAEPYGPPFEMQTKSLLEGGKALVLPGGSALLSEGVTLRVFSETNTLQLVVRTRECFYNSTNRSVNSAGPIQMQTADGKFTIEGEGFYWLQTNSSLIISNNVHTIIQSDVLQSPPTDRSASPGGADMSPLFISSRQFSYDGPSDRGVWRDSVQVTRTNVTGTNLTLNSGVLTAVVPMEGPTRQLHSLFAEKEVVVDYSGLNATGGRLDYAPDSGLVRVTDNATWHRQQWQGHGDELVIDRTNSIFQVNGHAWLQLPGQDLGESGLLSAPKPPPGKSGAPAKGSVEVLCDRYEVRTNWATFHDQVRLDELRDGRARGRMICQLMTVTFAGSNELQTVTADRDVVITEEDTIHALGISTNTPFKKFTGGRAFYTRTNSTLEMTQNPTWQVGPRSGKGDLLRLNTEQNEMLVRGNASLTLPATEFAGQLSSMLVAGTTNRPTKSGTNQFAEIFSEEYTLRTNTSVFLGGVYATHPEMHWSCEKLTVQLPLTGTTNLLAEGNVVFDLKSQKGPVHGVGDDALYSFGMVQTLTNTAVVTNALRLTGTPAVISSADGTNQSHLIIWDRTSGKFSFLGGDFKIQGVGPAVDTNIFVLPNKKLRK